MDVLVLIGSCKVLLETIHHLLQLIQDYMKWIASLHNIACFLLIKPTKKVVAL